ncbi:hypothetical protein PP7435_CHR2-0698 [Komagataella phaffii CBS 7435]|uniref:NAD(P)-binding protein n=2 Tax=Komagataella phaffii TaxID=460519 RepID=C4R151_KOMPG|nr:uncharacterized protein PAS_chr2-1_0865 [Komagataella phaffii GS115]AOA62760.1 GQ67_00644T0 [Komagataella phaffii]CAH2448249.1 hypothetical protein BQ9382_C2-3785 [Komagataella phaffii CBS 7435]AOA67908.1 GQ68_00744T0 [Komagataella phaffii GS115]CAY69225.1 hypothetical protein PAS_chr2-1_0865 [Komagataella phaffii GS115]CCA38384.1 hypothetical protein PP7435_CHR2-0698 [Komagataella phaffii CBS 7435]
MLGVPEPLVSSSRSSIDLVIYWTQLTLIHPALTWVFWLLGLPACFCLTVDIIWLIIWASGRKKVKRDKIKVLITGGSQGLGMEVVKKLVPVSDKVYILDVEKPKFHHEKLEYHKCNIADTHELSISFDKIIRDAGQLDILINNAAIRGSGAFMNSSQEHFLHGFNVNFLSHVGLMRKMIKMHSSNYMNPNIPRKNLHIITISSILGLVGPRNLSMYSATKSALLAFIESLSHEVRSQDVSFATFLPGQLDTAMFSDVSVTHNFLAPVVEAEKLATRIVDACLYTREGTFMWPMYTWAIPILRILPFTIVEWARQFSGMDNQIIQ